MGWWVGGLVLTVTLSDLLSVICTLLCRVQNMHSRAVRCLDRHWLPRGQRDPEG